MGRHKVGRSVRCISIRELARLGETWRSLIFLAGDGVYGMEWDGIPSIWDGMKTHRAKQRGNGFLFSIRYSLYFYFLHKQTFY